MNKYREIYDLLLSIDLPIYLCGHRMPDQDSISSCVALAELLNKQNKNAKILLKDEDRSEMAWQNDYLNVENEIKTKEYVFIMMDSNESKQLGDYKKYFDDATFTINIDHHQNNRGEANYVLSIPNCSSTCEIVYNILKIDGKEIFTKKVCDNLYAGMMNDTNCFSRRLTKSTLLIAQKLINLGADYKYIIKKTFSSRSLYQFKALARLIEEIKYDGFHYVILNRNEDCFKALTHNQIVKQIAEELRKIEEIETLVFLIVDKNKTIAKVMSNKAENADKIALLFGGGGHKREAGFTVFDVKPDEIITKIKDYLKN